MRFLLLMWAFLAFANSAFAEKIQGLIDRQDQAAYVRILSTGKTYKLSPMNTVVRAQIQKFSDGDFISGKGTIIEHKGLIYLAEIDFIGLRSLLGTWRTVTGLEYFEFRNFSDLFLYLLNLRNKEPPEVSHLDYSLAPDRGDKWSIFIASQSEVLAGSLRIKGNRLLLELFDPNDGRSEKIELYRLFSRLE